jgi:hypothetical protein
MIVSAATKSGSAAWTRSPGRDWQRGETILPIGVLISMLEIGALMPVIFG